jgi:branched-chain amino acid transport system permease protein
MTMAAPESFTWWESLIVLIIIVLGGMGSIPGVVLGAVVMVTMPELLRDFSDYRMLLLGVILVLPALFRPKGLWPAARTGSRQPPTSRRWQHRWFQLQRPWLQPPGRCCELPPY